MFSSRLFRTSMFDDDEDFFSDPLFRIPSMFVNNSPGNGRMQLFIEEVMEHQVTQHNHLTHVSTTVISLIEDETEPTQTESTTSPNNSGRYEYDFRTKKWVPIVDKVEEEEEEKEENFEEKIFNTMSIMEMALDDISVRSLPASTSYIVTLQD